MPWIVPGIHVFTAPLEGSRGWPGHRRSEATPFFERLCPAMTKACTLALQFLVALRVDQAVDPLRCGHGKAHRHRFARCRRQAVLRCLAMQVGAIGVGHDQAGVGRKNLAR